MTVASSDPLVITLDDVRAAAKRIAGMAERTPVMTSRAADERAGARLFFKCEHLQRTGAFKFRGACNALARLDAQQRSRGVVAFSSGNHAQAIACAATLHGTRSVIVMPQDAPPVKLAATRGYGAEVITYDRWRDDRERIGRELARERGLVLIPPFDHPAVMAGQGTAALELLEDVPDLDVLLVCTGGGGLLAGSAVAAKGLNPAIEVFGVEPLAGNDVQQSLLAGRRVRIEVPKTIADGAQTQQVGELTFPIIRALVAAVHTVEEAELIDTLRFLALRMKQVVEPTGCLGAALAFSGLPALRDRRVGVILSGGNVDPGRLAGWLAG